MDCISVLKRFDEAAGKFAENTAVQTLEKSLTYAQLRAQSQRIARVLRERATEQSRFVAIASTRSELVMACILAALRAGCAFVPMDAAWPEQRIKACLEGLDLCCVLCDSELMEKMKKAVDEAQVISIQSAEAAQPVIETHEWSADALCYTYVTSGSTGRPKRVAGRFGSVGHFIDWETRTFSFGPGTRVSQLTHPAFDAYLRDMFVPLCCGGTVCIPPSENGVIDVAQLAGWIDLQQINVIHSVPSLFRAMLNSELSPSYFRRLHHVFLAGEPLLPVDVGKWSSIFGDRIQLVNLYGPTETTMTKFYYAVTSADQSRRSIPIGRPMDGAQGLVLNKAGKVCMVGEVGEIYIQTRFRSLGYLGDPQLTAEVFLPNPLTGDPDDILYKTGDLGRVLADGNLEFLGRRDLQVKIRGVRIEMTEIENAVCGCPAVKDTAVIDCTAPDGSKYLRCFVVLNGSSVTVESLKETLRTHLPHSMMPGEIIAMPELPKLPNRKINRQALATWEAVAAEEKNVTLPRSELEIKVAELWAKALHKSDANLDINANFFETGGHSLLATILLGRIRATFKVSMPLKEFMEAPTIKDVAAQVESLLLEKAGAVRVQHLLDTLEDSKR